MRASTRTARSEVFEVHRGPGPPRLTAVLLAGRLVCELEVGGGGTQGSARLRGGREWSLTHPPGSGEWWVLDPDAHVIGTITRRHALGDAARIACGEEVFDLVPVGGWWRRRWEVRDQERHVVVTVTQRVLTRPIHDLRLRVGDLPAALPWVVAWWLAARTSRGVATTRRPRWDGVRS
ncbi:MAG: hypothetical protein WD638_03425 [Nitriliruptoraceae bacterium]